MITYRTAVLGDEQALADLHTTVIRDYYGPDYPAEAISEWSAHKPEKWKRILASLESRTTIALDGAAIVGAAGMNIAEGRMGVYVLPSHHRKGIARKLFAEQIDYARSHGIRRLDLSAPEKAVPFYEKMGYTMIGPAQHLFKNESIITVYDMYINL